MGNSIIFPAPKEKKVPLWMESHLYFCPKPLRNEDSEPELNKSFLGFCCGDKKPNKKIPFLYFREDTEVKKKQYLIIYFHGNSELLSHSYKALERYHAILRISIVSAEYPGYGIYSDGTPSEENVLEDAEVIIRHCMNTYNYKEENIILMGRSLGTGVAAQLGIKFPNLRGIVMISPYLSIRDVAKNMAGSFMSKFVPDIFRTRDIIEDLKPPLLFLHGLRDRLIPCTNSSYLYDHCNSAKMLNISPSMDHNKVDFRLDIYLPILKFFFEKLDMTEFQEDYAGEEVDRVSALGSLEKSPHRRETSRFGTNSNYNNSESTEITETRLIIS